MRMLSRMKINKMQRIDRWCGVPLCFLLTLLRRVLPKRPAASDGQPGNLLFVKLAEQGSTVLAYSAIKAAVKMVGREKVHFVVFDDNRFILDALELIPAQNVITISFDT